MGKLGHTLFLFSLPYICINLSKNVDLTLSLRESVSRASYVWPYPAVEAAPGGQLTLKDDSDATITKGPKMKEKKLKLDKPDSSE